AEQAVEARHILTEVADHGWEELCFGELGQHDRFTPAVYPALEQRPDPVRDLDLLGRVAGGHRIAVERPAAGCGSRLVCGRWLFRRRAGDADRLEVGAERAVGGWEACLDRGLDGR